VIQYFFIVVAPIAIQAALYLALSAAVRRISGKGGKGLLGFNPKWMVIGELPSSVSVATAVTLELARLCFLLFCMTDFPSYCSEL
jgi:hypothetical protein